ncbi:ankyrin repeat domain-containing protein [Candidatus Lariskella endosymbiont of Epinotia ramella]|uniref:ankyrin repeat domain-containing protein n=1 Tax=Candidatus Lariskella endosymbiont of Epinotia ramella TaxID=3066224 RepID=UPI0030D527A1
MELQMQEDKMQEIENLREQLAVFKMNGANPILTFANSTLDMDILREVFLQEKEQLLAEYNKEYDKYNILEKIFHMLHKLFGSEYKVHNINALDQYGNSVMHYVFGSPEIMDLVVKQCNADINVQNVNGENAVMKAAEYGRKESFEYLMKNGAVIDIVDNAMHQNILHKIAIQFKERDRDGQMYAVNILSKEKGILELLQAKDKDGKTPLNYAQENHLAAELSDKFTKLLKEHKLAFGDHTKSLEKRDNLPSKRSV